MACSGRYAEAWKYAAFWCVSSVLAGLDDSGLAFPKADLSCSYVELWAFGIRPNLGMVVYNLTRGTSGPITAVTDHTLTATGVTWGTGNSFRVSTLEGKEVATIEVYLDIAASDIHAAMAASGACSCTLATWATGYLEKLNVIDAAIYHQCPCAKPNITDDMKKAHLAWMNVQLDNIRMGKVELCLDATGSEFPSVGWAEQSVTEFAAERIVVNDMLKDS